MTRAKRKLDHINHALVTGQTRESGFDDIRFIHQSIPNVNVENVSLTTFVGELTISSPIFINAMTGGGGRATRNINGMLAEIASTLNIPIAVGSQMSALKDPDEKSSYQIVREKNQNGIVLGNIGSEATVDQAMQCIDMLEANAIQIHLNVIQELVMPEGDRDFKGALSRIEKICNHVSVPVIVKEVGFGMSIETITKLKDIGVTVVDVGGYGGTNFSKIENQRRAKQYEYFNDWGIPTVVSIVEAINTSKKMSILASGGVQNALDVAKAIALGANATGMAGKVLNWVQRDGLESTINHLDNLLAELKIIMTAVGAENISSLQKTPLIIQGKSREWLEQRGIDTKAFSQRTY